MTHKLDHLIERTSFAKLIAIIVSIGIVSLTFAITLAVNYHVNNSFENKIIEDISRETNEFARRSSDVLLNDDAISAQRNTQSIASNPFIISARIIDINGNTFYTSVTDNNTMPDNTFDNTLAIVDNLNSWRLTAPVYFTNPSEKTNTFSSENKNSTSNIIGYVEIIKSKERLRQLTHKTLMYSIVISATLAALLLITIIYLNNKLIRPINQLVGIMNKAQEGEYFIRSEIQGPKEINDIALAYNSMVNVLEVRDAQLKQAHDAAIQAAKLKGDFAAKVTHELRTPMNGVLGMLDLLKETKPSKKQSEYIQVAKNSAYALLLLIDDILDFSRVDAGKANFKHVSFNIKSLVSEIIDLLSIQAIEKKLSITLSIADDVPTDIIAVESRIRQILINLIGNAIKFTNTGTIDIAISCTHDANSLFLKASIQDTGIGIAQAEQANVFNAFTQVDGTATRKHNGSGLGLAICKKLVNQMNGKIGLESELGQGSTFWFAVPIKVAEAANEESSLIQQTTESKTYNSEQTQTSKAINILIVEDNKTNQYVALGMFNELGYKPIVVSNGLEAYHEVIENHYDIIFMDIQMPMMDGYEATKKIRRYQQESRQNETPIISMTANIGEDDKKKCIDVGMNDFLNKPLSIEAIEVILAKHTSNINRTRYKNVKANIALEHHAQHKKNGNAISRIANIAIDKNVFLTLKESVGEVIHDMIAAFSEDIPKNINQIKQGIERNDCKRVLIAAHSLKGSSIAFGAYNFSHLCQDIEADASDGRILEIKNKLPLLETSAHELLITLDNVEAGSKENHPAQGKQLSSTNDLQHSEIKQPAMTSDNTQSTDILRTILIIDDQADMRIAIEAKLNKLGFTIKTAGSGKEGLAICQEQDVDLILMDGIMPDMDGFATCTAIRKNERNKTTPILMLTALDDSLSIEKAFAVGANDYIAKPINFAVLKKRIDRLIEANNKEKYIQQLANHDHLTGLPNRNTFIETLEATVKKPNKAGHLLAVIIIALDRFKYVNDTFGHLTGDQLLKAASERIVGTVRENDYIARLGSDEFAILVNNQTSAENIASIAEKVCNLFKQPFILNAHKIHVTCSVGVSIYPIDALSPQDLIKYADTAMFRAKEKRDTYQFYELGMETMIVKRVKMEAELRLGIEKNQLVLHYQPQKDLRSNKICGAESLVRWQHPNRGLIPPNEFIPLAESCGLIVELGLWVLRKACEQYVEWRMKGYPPIYLTVNISGRQIEDSGFIERVEQILYETDMFCEHLELELTETAILQNPEYAIAILQKLRDMNIRLAIDDFGVGHSSLSYLRRLPVDTLKIDKSFVRDITVNNADANLLNGIISLANNLELTTIAEGVETVEQEAILKAANCEAVQGFLINKPLSSQDFEEAILLNHMVQLQDVSTNTISPSDLSNLQQHNSTTN